LIISPPIKLTSMVCEPTAAKPGDSIICTIRLSNPAPPAGVTVEVRSGNPCPDHLLLPGRRTRQPAHRAPPRNLLPQVGGDRRNDPVGTAAVKPSGWP
jgi:hypothetical protein